jgi:hypothetical protein
MVIYVKTTIDIPDTLMARCKTVIAEQHVTFRSLVEEGLSRCEGDYGAGGRDGGVGHSDIGEKPL